MSLSLECRRATNARGNALRNSLIGLVTLVTLVAFAIPKWAGAEESEYVAQAKKNSAKRAGKQTEWLGPTSAPKVQAGKRIIFVSMDHKPGRAEIIMGDSIMAAAKRIGWTASIIDGKGNAEGWVAAFKEALTQKVDGIITSAQAEAAPEQMAEFERKGIPVVGIHAAGMPGPAPDLKLFTNIQSYPPDIGKAIGEFGVAHSNGKGKGVILYDSRFGIAKIKSQNMKESYTKCPDCVLLGFEDSILTETKTRMPKLFKDYSTKYKADFQYVMAIDDFYYDALVPALKEAGAAPNSIKLIGSDGSRESYERIRKGDYQIATVPEPWDLFAYEAIDEMNRAFHKMPPSGFIQPCFVVTKENVDSEGGDKNSFMPSNNYRDRYLKMWMTGGSTGTTSKR